MSRKGEPSIEVLKAARLRVLRALGKARRVEGYKEATRTAAAMAKTTTAEIERDKERIKASLSKMRPTKRTPKHKAPTDRPYLKTTKMLSGASRKIAAGRAKMFKRVPDSKTGVVLRKEVTRGVDLVTFFSMIKTAWGSKLSVQFTNPVYEEYGRFVDLGTGMYSESPLSRKRAYTVKPIDDSDPKARLKFKWHGKQFFLTQAGGKLPRYTKPQKKYVKRNLGQTIRELNAADPDVPDAALGLFGAGYAEWYRRRRAGLKRGDSIWTARSRKEIERNLARKLYGKVTIRGQRPQALDKSGRRRYGKGFTKVAIAAIDLYLRRRLASDYRKPTYSYTSKKMVQKGDVIVPWTIPMLTVIMEDVANTGVDILKMHTPIMKATSVADRIDVDPGRLRAGWTVSPVELSGKPDIAAHQMRGRKGKHTINVKGTPVSVSGDFSKRTL